jgi:hypothetical protein
MDGKKEQESLKGERQSVKAWKLPCSKVRLVVVGWGYSATDAAKRLKLVASPPGGDAEAASTPML